MIRIDELKFDDKAGIEELTAAAAKRLKLPVSRITGIEILKESVDARDKKHLKFVYSVAAGLKGKSTVPKKIKNTSVFKRVEYRIKEALKHDVPPPAVIGFGPAGIFASYALASAGLCPVIIERGSDCEERKLKVQSFWKDGILDPECNVQFGEGGAGTFSDGKLSTMVNDREGRQRFVLETFVRHGAPEHILYDAKPHLGTDMLTGIIRSIREEIVSLGGTFRFNTRFTDFKQKNGRLSSVILNNGEELNTDTALLAIGHSARDTFELLREKGVRLEKKSFAIGVRVEHLQEKIDKAQYGIHPGLDLPAASYKLTYHAGDGRGVYSFCMCPGGYVVNSSSEPESLCVNGMSYTVRDGINANSAIVVTVTPEDFPSEDVLSGVELQRSLEKAAYRLCGGAVPVQRFGDFIEKRPTSSFGEVLPQIKGRFEASDLRALLPGYIASDIGEAFASFGKRIAGFDSPDALLSGIESRTSSPVRILRDENFNSNIRGLIPCGEGAGYAGGIMSAAMDGLKCAERMIDTINNG